MRLSEPAPVHDTVSVTPPASVGAATGATEITADAWLVYSDEGSEALNENVERLATVTMTFDGIT